MHATFETGQLSSHTRTLIIDTITALQCSQGEVIPVSGGHELPTSIHDILDKAVCQGVGYAAFILCCLFIKLSSG